MRNSPIQWADLLVDQLDKMAIQEADAAFDDVQRRSNPQFCNRAWNPSIRLAGFLPSDSDLADSNDGETE